MTDRLVRLSSDFNIVSTPIPEPIQFRHIALLVLGGLVAGSCIGFLIYLAAQAFTHSRFIFGLIFSTSLYGSFLVGYHWLAQERGWDSLRTRFSPVGAKPLILSALAAVALIAFIVMVAWILRSFGINFAKTPPPFILDNWTQLPLAFLLIVGLAPLTEELVFRGLLLDWLRQKMNVGAAAIILSLIFSLLHANPFSLGAVGWLAFADRFLLGLAASVVTIKYRSLRPAFVLHATVNTIAGFAGALQVA